jgi:precorrin-4 methylase|tara:strand:+ start:176 stop:433 length:258 start_codon:yes stop_codon:yes gene_type:complete
MPDPRMFKRHYIIESFSRKLNQIREQHLATEMTMKNRCQDLTIARARAKEFANSLNEVKELGVDDWQAMLHLQESETTKVIVPVD